MPGDSLQKGCGRVPHLQLMLYDLSLVFMLQEVTLESLEAAYKREDEFHISSWRSNHRLELAIGSEHSPSHPIHVHPFTSPPPPNKSFIFSQKRIQFFIQY